MKLRLLVGAVIVATSGSLAAHTMNVLPSHYVQAKTESAITVDLFASNMTFQADKGVKPDAFKVIWPDGTVHAADATWQGKRKSSADVSLPQAGTYRLEMGGQPRFFTSYQLHGERKRFMGDKVAAAKQLPKDATHVETTQARHRALAFVTVNAPTHSTLAAAEQGLSVHFGTHPADIVAGESVTLTMLLDGKAAAGVEVELAFDGELYRNEPGRQRFVSDANGQIQLVAPQAGRYLLEAELARKVQSTQADQVRDTLTLSFEAALP